MDHELILLANCGISTTENKDCSSQFLDKGFCNSAQMGDNIDDNICIDSSAISKWVHCYFNFIAPNIDDILMYICILYNGNNTHCYIVPYWYIRTTRIDNVTYMHMCNCFICLVIKFSYRITYLFVHCLAIMITLS